MYIHVDRVNPSSILRSASWCPREARCVRVTSAQKCALVINPIYTYIYVIYIYLALYIYTYMYMYMYIRVCMCVCVYIYIHINIRIYIYIYIYIYVCVCVYIYIHLSIYLYLYMFDFDERRLVPEGGTLRSRYIGAEICARYRTRVNPIYVSG